MSVTIEQAFKQVLEAAIHQVKYKTYEREPDNDAVEAFIEDLFAVLFPSNSQTIQAVTVPTVAATVTVSAPAAAPEKPKRGRKPKAPAEAPAAAPEPKKRGRKPKAVTPPPAPEATEAPPAPAKTKNLEKPFTATNKKHIKKWAEEVGAAEPDMKELFNHLNAMSAEDFNGSTFEQHVKNFLQPKEEVAQVGDKLAEVPFNGKTYYVNEKTDRVFEERGENNYVGVGYIGMAAFADMKL
jgi:hypothetical protein